MCHKPVNKKYRMLTRRRQLVQHRLRRVVIFLRLDCLASSSRDSPPRCRHSNVGVKTRYAHAASSRSVTSALLPGDQTIWCHHDSESNRHYHKCGIFNEKRRPYCNEDYLRYSVEKSNVVLPYVRGRIAWCCYRLI